MGACFKGYADIAELLIQNGAALDQQHGNGGTALMFAAMFGRNELVKLLLLHGANTEICDSRGLTAVDLAAQQGNEQAISLLQHSQEEIEFKDKT
ncbi:Ankyrin repeat protein [compost metagenome]